MMHVPIRSLWPLALTLGVVLGAIGCLDVQAPTADRAAPDGSTDNDPPTPADNDEYPPTSDRGGDGDSPGGAWVGGEVPVDSTACAPSLDVASSAPSYGRGPAVAVTLRGDLGFVAGRGGLEILDLTTPADARGLGWVALPGPAVAMQVSDPWVYVASDRGVHLVDIHDPAAPVAVAFVEVRGPVVAAASDAGVLTVVLELGGLQTFDLSSGASVPLGRIDQAGLPVALQVSDGIAYVVDVERGLELFDVSDPADPRRLADVPLSDNVGGIDVVGDLAYVAANGDGLRIFDVSDPSALVEVGAFEDRAHLRARGVRVVGGRAYVLAAPSPSLRVLDVSDPTAPVLLGAMRAQFAKAVDADDSVVLVGTSLQGLKLFDAVELLDEPIASIEPAGDARQVALQAGLAYVADSSGGLAIVDVSDPAAPVPMGRFEAPGPVSGVAVAGRRAFVASKNHDVGFRSAGHLQVVDVADPAAPVELGRAAFEGFPTLVRARGDHVYVSAHGLRVFDVSDPTTPEQVGMAAMGTSVSDIRLIKDTVWLASRVNGVTAWDLSDPGTPRRVSGVELPRGAYGLAGDGQHLYVADGWAGLHVLDVSDREAPRSVAEVSVPMRARSMELWGDRLLVSDDQSVIRMLDVSTPTAPRVIAALPSPGLAHSMLAEGDRVWVADGPVMLTALAEGCQPTLGDPAGSDAAEAPAPALQFANFLTGGAVIDLDLGGRPVARRLGYTQATALAPVGGRDLTGWSSPRWPDPELRLDLTLPGSTGGRTAIVAGSPAEPRLLLPPASQRAPDGHIRLRLVHAAPGVGPVHASLVSLGGNAALGEPTFGEWGPAVDVRPGVRWELMLSARGVGRLLELPALPAGAAVRLVVAGATPAELFVALLDGAGAVTQLGPPGHLAAVRVAHLAAGLGDLSAQADSTADHELWSAVPSMTAVEHQASAPGARRFEVRADGGAEVVLDAVPLAPGGRYTLMTYADRAGRLQATAVQDPPGSQTGGTALLRLFHAAPSLGKLNAWLLPRREPRPVLIPLARRLELGSATAEVPVRSSSYDLVVDGDGDGVADRRFESLSFPDYGLSLVMTQDREGRWLLGTLSPSGGLWFTYAVDDLAQVRLVHAAVGLGNVTVEYPGNGPTPPREAGLRLGEAQGYAPLLAGRWQMPWSERIGAVEIGRQGHLPVDVRAGRRYSVVLTSSADGGGVDATFFDDGVLDDLSAPRVLDTLGSAGATELQPPDEAGAASLSVDRDGDGRAELTFDFEVARPAAPVTAIVVEDERWPFVFVDNGHRSLVRAYANERAATVRVAWLPTQPGSVRMRFDGDEPGRIDTPARGSMVPGAYFGVSVRHALLAGERTVTVDGVGDEVRARLTAEFEAGHDYTIVGYGDRNAPTLELLDDTALAPPPGAAALHLLHVAAGAPAVDVWGFPFAGEADEIAAARLAQGLSYGTWSAPIPEAHARLPQLGIDRDRDGAVDWHTFPMPAPDLSYAFIIGAPDSPAILRVPADGPAWIIGQEGAP